MKTTRTLTWTATIMAALCILAPAIAPAADIAWTNISGGNWSVAANWNPNQVPGSADTVLITASGTYTVILDASATVAGLTLGGVSGIQTLTNSAGSLTLNNSSFVNANGVLVLAGSGTKNLYGVLTNAGIIQITGSGALYCYGGSGAGKLINLAGGLVDIQSDVSITSSGYSSEAIVNQGTVRKSGGTGTNTIAPIFNNTGTVDVQTGTVSLSGSYTLTGGTLNFGINSVTNFGKIKLSGSAALTGTFSANLNNGYVPISGNSFAVLTYGSRTGTFTNFNLPFAVAWQTNYGSTAFTLTVLNVRPVLGSPTDQTVDELTPLTVGNPATDADAGQTLTYSLLNPPAGASINSSGTITWTPTEAEGPATNTITTVAIDNGSPALSATNSFTVVVNEVNFPPVLPLLANTNINELTTLTVTNTATDSDIPVNALTYTLLAAPINAVIDTNGVITWTPTESQGPSTNTFTTVVTDTNIYAINAQSLTATNTFTVVVNEINVAPLLTLPPNTNINEMVAYSANATATDADIPTNALTFALVSGPTNLTVSSAGVINWIPAEDQGPSTNTVKIRVTDSNPQAVNATSLSTTNSYTIIVSEVNVAPVLTLPPNTNINEQVAFTATATATDADIPTNTLTFALVSGPSGLTVSPTGVINWNPLENQGPSTNTVTISVTDTNPAAINTKSLSVTNNFQIIVSEVNVAPVLPGQTNLTINEGVTLTVTNTATDADVPANALTYTLLSAPGAAALSTNGVITWVTTEADGPSTNTFTTRVTDNGSPSLSATNTFTVLVNELNVAPSLTLPPNQTINELTFYTNNATATDVDVPANALTFTLVSGPANLNVSTSGAITWTPTEAQGPSTNVVQIRVTDTNPPAVNATSLSVTSSFTLTVNEVNVAPVITVPGDQTIHAGVSLSLTATATDADLPTNTLTFALVSGPTGLTVSGTGLITWPTGDANAGTTNPVSVRVFDNGTPSLSATGTFSVVVVSRPLLLTPAISGANLMLTWTAIPVTSYRLEFNTNLSVTNWTSLAGDVTAVGNTASKLDPLTTSNRFYRVRVLP